MYPSRQGFYANTKGAAAQNKIWSGILSGPHISWKYNNVKNVKHGTSENLAKEDEKQEKNSSFSFSHIPTTSIPF